MAHESFEDEEVARLLNERYISIKVDREERPDIDSVYMTVCQALTGHGGWPLSVFLTPDQKPFYAGTYFPKTSRYGQPGFMDVLGSLSSQYQEDQERILKAGEQIVSALKKAGEEAEAIKGDVLSKTYEHFKSTFDPEYGGFGQEPKFPSPHQLMFLLRYARLHNKPVAIKFVEKTLQSMAQGGIRDHLGGGFARYSVDREWLVPHFEKMLYDQAMLMMAYSEAYQVTKKPAYAKIVADIFRYVSRELTDAKGGFYSAEDADSEGVEGKFYVWQMDEVFDVLGDEEGTLFCDVYDITNQGNFEGTNIPHLINASMGDMAEKYGLSEAELEMKLAEARERLFQSREKRVHPHKDDKILTSWNGLMIAALATAYQAFQNKDYLNAAERAFRFLENNLRVNGRWMARYREGEIKHSGYLDDYAFMIWAADALYETTFDVDYLAKIKAWTSEMTERFWDKESFGFFLSDEESELFVRPKDVYDGAIPSGNSVAALMLFKLARRTGDLDYEMFVDKMFNRFGAEVNRYPMGHTFFLSVYLLAKTGTKELVVLTKKESEFEQQKDWQARFHPEVITLVGDQNSLVQAASFTKDFMLLDEQTTFYLCEHHVCQRPITDWAPVEKALQ